MGIVWETGPGKEARGGRVWELRAKEGHEGGESRYGRGDHHRRLGRKEMIRRPLVKVIVEKVPLSM